MYGYSMEELYGKKYGIKHSVIYSIYTYKFQFQLPNKIKFPFLQSKGIIPKIRNFMIQEVGTLKKQKSKTITKNQILPYNYIQILNPYLSSYIGILCMKLNGINANQKK